MMTCYDKTTDALSVTNDVAFALIAFNLASHDLGVCNNRLKKLLITKHLWFNFFIKIEIILFQPFHL